MATKRKNKLAREADYVSELLELAEKVHLPEGYFDGDVEDECQEEAKDKASEINNCTLMEQLEFLLKRGYKKERLEELIREGGIGQ